jgi:hypothetical protein
LPFCPIALLLIQKNDVYWKIKLNAALLPRLKNKKTRNYPSDSHLSRDTAKWKSFRRKKMDGN